MNANCANIDGSYTCSCQPGYTGDGLNCRGTYVLCCHTQQAKVVNCFFVDECTDSTSVCNGADGCENMGGSYVCLCGAGLSWNGTFCEGMLCMYIHTTTIYSMSVKNHTWSGGGGRYAL